MRIRKNSRLVSSSSTASLLVCQLNRSPWDIESTTQDGSGVGNLTRNGSMVDTSRYSGESMELSFEYMPPQSKQESKEDEIGSLDDGRVEYGSGLKHSTLFTKKKKAVETFSPAPPPPVPPVASAPKRRGRPRKVVEGVSGLTATATTATTNPYEFYYYSGFGPRWGKRRGEDGSTNKGDNENEDNGRSSDNVSEDEVEIDNGGNNNNNSNNNNSGEDDGSGKKGGYIENVIDEELDYIEDDEEEEELYGGRRVRKPIKARSLKSLM